MHPRARKTGLVTSKVGDETIVYDTETKMASCLNELVTAVWEACDGKNDTTSIQDTIKQTGHQEATEQFVQMALEQLGQAGLIEHFPEFDEKIIRNPSRREMLQKLGTRSVALLPIVTTITVQPAFAQASTNLPHGAHCTSSTQCLSGCCKASEMKCKVDHHHNCLP